MRRRFFWLAPLALLLVLLPIALTWLITTEAGLHWAYGRLGASLPGTLEVRQLEGRLMGPLHVQGMHYRDSSTDVQIDRLTFDWSPLALLAARLAIQDLSVNGVRVILQPSTATQPPSRSPRLPLALRIEHLELGDIQIQRAGQTPYEVESLELSVRINKEIIQIDRLELRARDIELSAQGRLDVKSGTERLTMKWRVAPPGVAALAGEGEIVGNLSDFSLTQRLTAPIPAVLNAKIRNIFSSPTWEAELDIPPEPLAKLKPGWSGTLGVKLAARGDRARFQGQGTLQARYPAVPNVTGAFRIRGNTDGRMELDELVLAVAGTDAKLIANAKYHVRKEIVDARLRWNDVRWPLAGEPSVISPAGELKIDGTLGSYRLTLATQTHGPKLPRADWNIAGGGDRSHVAFDTIVVKALSGSMQGAGRVAWSPRLAWEVQVEAKGLNPGVQWREWPGALGFRARAAGSAEELNAELSELRGRLRGQPLSAKARVVRRGAQYPVIAAAIQSGEASVNVAGGLQTQWDLAWQVNAPDLAALLPRAGGRVQGTGQVAGNRGTPTVQVRLTAAALVYDRMRIEKLDADASVDFADRNASQINLQLSDAVLGGHDVQHIALHADGLVARHNVTLELSTRDIATRIRSTGSYRAAAAWDGGLVDGTLRLGGQNWTLASRPALLIGATQIKLDDTCWSAAPSRLCAEFDWNSGGKTNLGFIADRAPLALFAPLLPQPIELRGRFDANARASFSAGRITSADARFQTTNGDARLATSEAGITFSYRQISAQLRVDASGLRSGAELTLVNGDGGTADISLPQFSRSTSADQPIEGQLKLTLRDLTPLAALLPDVRNLKGSLHSDIAVRGTLADPSVHGQVQLTDASARITANGILVRDARLIARSDGHRQIQLNGFARSGDGEIGLSGRLDLEKGLAWRAELRLAGSRFQAVDLPEADVEVTPDLHLRLTPGELTVEGSVLIPRARITVRPRGGSVTPSPDVVIVGDSDNELTPASRWNVTARIQVILGDSVAFEGFGLTGNVTGSLNILDTPDQVTTARGELRIVNGKYEAYGQKLEIERGRLLFVGGPVDDPGIDVRAVRRIDQIVAGVEVRGTLKSAELTLFSDPPLNDADTLSYLLFGKPIESADAAQGATLAAAARALKLTGGEHLAQRLGARFGIEEVEIEKSPGTDQAALVLGKRLSPRLYINYSIGLFESVNVFRIRYQLATHWILQAESGVNKGGDLLYTIER